MPRSPFQFLPGGTPFLKGGPGEVQKRMCGPSPVVRGFAGRQRVPPGPLFMALPRDPGPPCLPEPLPPSGLFRGLAGACRTAGEPVAKRSSPPGCPGRGREKVTKMVSLCLFLSTNAKFDRKEQGRIRRSCYGVPGRGRGWSAAGSGRSGSLAGIVAPSHLPFLIHLLRLRAVTAMPRRVPGTRIRIATHTQ